ncbi:MAG TPA: signal peptidase I [Planctomycetota bacterium]|nr:signal peptidase I [Planctomycetota bacterium]
MSGEPAGDAPPASLPRRARRGRKAILALTAAIVLLFAVTRWVLVPYRIRGPSMRPTLLGREDGDRREDGDIVAVSRIAYVLSGPARWDVVVVRHPGGEPMDPPGSGPHESVKRVVGLPGERIEIQAGRVVANGLELEPPAPLKTSKVVEKGEYGRTPVQLGEDEYFLLGDNSYLSSDSRRWGPIPRSMIEGRLVFVLYPPDRVGLVR